MTLIGRWRLVITIEDDETVVVEEVSQHMETEYYESDFPVSPGSVLEEELEARGMTQKELAKKMGRPAQAISEIINGKKALTTETALELEQVLGVPAYLWVRLEGRYRLALAKAKLRSA